VAKQDPQTMQLGYHALAKHTAKLCDREALRPGQQHYVEVGPIDVLVDGDEIVLPEFEGVLTVGMDAVAPVNATAQPARLFAMIIFGLLPETKRSAVLETWPEAFVRGALQEPSAENVKRISDWLKRFNYQSGTKPRKGSVTFAPEVAA